MSSPLAGPPGPAGPAGRPGPSGPAGPPGPPVGIITVRGWEDLPAFEMIQLKAEESKIALREKVAITLLGLFGLTVVVELALSILAAFAVITPGLLELLVPTFVAVPQVPVLLFSVVKWLFPTE